MAKPPHNRSVYIRSGHFDPVGVRGDHDRIPFLLRSMKAALFSPS
jgi:hypothetical protein